MEARLLDIARVAGSRVRYMVPFINLALATAMRRGEICKLEWHEVDFEKKWIFVPAGKAKSGKRRWIPITDRSEVALRQLEAIKWYDPKTKELSTYVLPATG